VVVFVLAAAAAYLLCILLKRSTQQDSNWLHDNAHALFAFLLVALLIRLAAAVAGPYGFAAFLFILATLSLALGVVSLLCAPKTGSDLNGPFVECL
jgi:nitrate reductase NapE component